jgi:hypothetical protein
VLFSQPRVADFINQKFEPVWESVRPVPIVRIDFGNGNVLTRTLHGNILTSVCTPDGFVVDALPGIYTESEYVLQLNLILATAKVIQSVPAEERQTKFATIHRWTAEVSKHLAEREHVSKYTIEAPIKNALRPAKEVKRPVTVPEDVASWKTLEEDTKLNERTRRRQIHELLARTGLVRPEKVTRPIYKDVLHADLDDPYLGLGEVLFATYPFAKEDAAHRGG